MKTLIVLLFSLFANVIVAEAANKSAYFNNILRMAESGSTNAQWRVANMYRYGMGVPKDLNEALKWLRMAQMRGSGQQGISELVAELEQAVSDIGQTQEPQAESSAIRLSCRGETIQHGYGGLKNQGEVEHFIYMNPDKNQLAIIRGNFQLLGAEELETSANSYSFMEKDFENRDRRIRFEVDRTTLVFSAGYNDLMGIFYTAEGICIVIETKI